MIDKNIVFTTTNLKCKIFAKQNKITSVLDFYAGSDNEKLQQLDIYKMIKKMYVIGLFSETLYNEFRFAIMRYRFYLVDCLSKCDNLRICLCKNVVKK